MSTRRTRPRRSSRIQIAANVAAVKAKKNAALLAAHRKTLTRKKKSTTTTTTATSTTNKKRRRSTSTTAKQKQQQQKQQQQKHLPAPPRPVGSSSLLLAKAKNFPVCKHISNISAVNVSKVSKVIQRPILWRCGECNHCNDAWICLTCGHVGCGRFLGRHAYNHCTSHRTGTHDLALCLSNGFCFCYRCDEYVISDNNHDELAMLQTMLSDVLHQNFSASTTRRGSVIRSKSTSWEFNRNRRDLVQMKDRSRQLKRDAMDTMLVKRR
jgi:uncharacterized UBP type Zn finger protein